MYSYERYRLREPLVGGFVVEKPTRYVMSNKCANVKIYKVPIEKTQYSKLLKELQLYKYRDTNYNMFSFLTYLFRKKVNIPYSYTCVEFVIKLLSKENELFTIQDLEEKYKEYLYFEGKISDISNIQNITKDDYFKKIPRRVALYHNLKAIKKLARAYRRKGVIRQ